MVFFRFVVCGMVVWCGFGIVWVLYFFDLVFQYGEVWFDVQLYQVVVCVDGQQWWFVGYMGYQYDFD